MPKWVNRGIAILARQAGVSRQCMRERMRRDGTLEQSEELARLARPTAITARPLAERKADFNSNTRMPWPDNQVLLPGATPLAGIERGVLAAIPKRSTTRGAE